MTHMVQMAIYRLRRHSKAPDILSLCEWHGGVVVTKRAMGEIFTIKKHFSDCDRPRKPWHWVVHSNATTTLAGIPDDGLVITVDRSPWFLLERCNA